MNKRCRAIMDELILSGELEEIKWFKFAPKQELKLRLKDMLEDYVDEKYSYVSNKNKALSKTIENKALEDGIWLDCYNLAIRDIVSSTITTRTKATYLSFVYKNGVIRFPTERECFRLQGFSNDFIFPDEVDSNNLYKQAGNGMSRNILDMIFTQIFKSKNFDLSSNS